MKLSDLVPWKWGSTNVPVDVQTHNPQATTPFAPDIKSAFDSFFSNFPFENVGSTFKDLKSFSPNVNVEETDQDIVVQVEVPGMNEEDISLTLKDDYLELKGEKKSESERTEGSTKYFESSYGSFRRIVPLDADIDADSVDASLKNGLLSITLPKVEGTSQPVRTISINAA